MGQRRGEFATKDATTASGKSKMRVLQGWSLVGGLSNTLGIKDNCGKTTISNEEGIVLPLHAEREKHIAIECKAEKPKCSLCPRTHKTCFHPQEERDADSASPISVSTGESSADKS